MDYNKYFDAFKGNSPKEKIDRELMLFTQFLYNNPLIPRLLVDTIISKVLNLISCIIIPYIQLQMEESLKPIAITAIYSKVQFILECNKNMFDSFSTEHLRLKMYQEKSYYVPPTMYKIGEREVYSNTDAEIEILTKSVTATRVSLEDTLKIFLESPGIYEEIIAYMSDSLVEDTYITNYMNGELWKTKYAPLFKDKIVFPLVLYNDDFEVRNPLGSHAGEEKFSGTYVSFACLPPSMAGSLENIFLSSICKSKHLKEFGNESIFGPIIDELNVLSTNGTIININKQEIQVYFQCVLIIGDNLGMNGICGFNTNFSKSNYFCRICNADKHECSKMIEEDLSLYRKYTYEDDIKKIDSESTGILEECVFNKIHNHHITVNISVDDSHNFAEGTGSNSISKVTNALIQKKIPGLTVPVINNRMEMFPFPEYETNKPRPFFTKSAENGDEKVKVKQSASEMMCLIRYLGLMIGDLIPPNDVHWKLYLYVRRIAGIISSPKLTRPQINLLQDLMRKHNALYIQLFGKLKPKAHIWLHGVTSALLNGPTVHYSTLKFERKNRSLKFTATATSTNLNLAHTIAIRHQLQFCYCREFHTITNTDMHVGPLKDDNRRPLGVSLKQKTPEKLKYVEILGKKFEPETICIIRFVPQVGPVFGKVKELYSCSDGVYLEIEEYITYMFSKYYHAYEILPSNKSAYMIYEKNLPRLPPCLLVNKNGFNYIATRYDC